MSTLQIEEYKISTDEVLGATSQLSNEELEAFCNGLLIRRAERRAPHLSKDETRLFQIINKGLSQDKLWRYRQLKTNLDDETLTEDEHSELTDLIDQMELLDAERVTAMVELAQIRNMTLAAVAESLGLGKANALV